MVHNGRKTVELRGVSSKKSNVGSAMAITHAGTLMIIISYSLGSQSQFWKRWDMESLLGWG